MNIPELKRSLPQGAPSAQFGVIEQQGCIPQDAYMTTNLVELVNVDGQWELPAQPRMDGVIRRRATGGVEVVEMNKLQQGDQVVLGTTEDTSQGIKVTPLEDSQASESANFGFMSTEVSRERRVDYAKIADTLESAKNGDGKIVWVLGPAVVHSGGIEDMAWLIKHGYVGALFGGNAVAAHDIEHSISRTSLGLDDNSRPVHNGHRNHLEAIAKVRQLGSIANAVEEGLVTEGIMYECVKNDVPFVLAGSIRDDGPLPDTITDVLQSQNAMRAYTTDASAVVMIATALHSIATGNMTPTYRVEGDEIKPIPVICVDSDEFVVNKLSDRGTSQATGVIGNATDFLSRLVTELKSRQTVRRDISSEE